MLCELVMLACAASAALIGFCEADDATQAPVNREAGFGQPPPWQSRARVLAGKSGRISHRQQLREELRPTRTREKYRKTAAPLSNLPGGLLLAQAGSWTSISYCSS